MADFRHAVSLATSSWLKCAVLPLFTDEAVDICGALAQNAGDRTGHFLVNIDRQAHVCHVKDVRGADDLEIAAAVACHLATHGIPVVCYRANRLGEWESEIDGLAVTVTSYLPARHGNGSAADASALGLLLGRAHAELRDFEMVKQVESRCRDVVDQLVRTREQVLAGELIGVLVDRMEIVRRAAAGYDAWFTFAGSPQCVHGDITPGNVLFDETGKAVLCDFEDAAFSFRPRIFDLASAVLRFCLVPPPGVDGATATIRRTVLLEAYAHAGWAMSEPADLIRGIRNLIDHNVMIMCALTISGVETASGEWNKFARMYEVLEEWV